MGRKKVEHHVKSLIYDGDTVSVHKPSFYKARFETFMKTKVFRQKRRDPNARSMPNLQPKGLHRNQMSSLPRHIIQSQNNVQSQNFSQNNSQNNTSQNNSFRNNSLHNNMQN